MQYFEVRIMSYEIRLIGKSAFNTFSLEYIIINKVHRIKNVDFFLSQIVRSFIPCGQLLIMGTLLLNSFTRC